MVKVLAAHGPHPSLGPQADLFGRFVGRWDADYSFIAEDGSVRHKRGEVLFGWVLDGHALQDIFLSYPDSGSDERKMVTGLRWVDPRTGRWTLAFVARCSAGRTTTSARIRSYGAAKARTTEARPGGSRKSIT